MPHFENSYNIKHSEKKLTHKELVRGLRFNIAGDYNLTLELDYYNETAYVEINGIKVKTTLDKVQKLLKEFGFDININNENYLAKQRLGTLAVLFASQDKPFLNDYHVKSFKCRFNNKAKSDFDRRYEKLFNEAFSSNNQSEELKKELADCWEKNLIGHFTDDFLCLLPVVKSTILAYLIYKTLRIMLLQLLIQ